MKFNQLSFLKDNNILYSCDDSYLLDIFMNNHVKYSKVNDGEFYAIAQHKGQNCDGHHYFSEMGVEIKQSLLNYRKSDFILNNYILSTAGPFLKNAPFMIPLMEEIKTKNPELIFYYTSYFHYLKGKPELFLKFLNFLNNKNCVIVGPKYLKAMKLINNFEMIEVPLKNCYLKKDDLIAQIKLYNQNHINTYFLFSASMTTNVIIDHFKYDNNNSYIDIGSVWDLFFQSAQYSFIRHRSGIIHFKKYYNQFYKKYLV